jgi:hypothetical protein|tara:strand:+ start:147 stop:749 length:603 start_codon:yes stop_codon:yes gene_type:complete
MALTTTTKLEAINTMLSAIGESPVNSLTSGLVDAEQAETILNSVNREVQSMGWSFNTDLKRQFVPDTNKQIQIPSNILRIDMAQDKTDKLELVQRGTKLYNRASSSFFMDDDITQVLMNAVVLLDFEDLPEAARRYITIRAARIFQDRVVSSNDLHIYQERDELMALVELKDSDNQVLDTTIFDNYSVVSVLDRTGGGVL